MNFKLQKIERLSGLKASVYTVVAEGDAGSLFAQFLAAYRNDYFEEVEDILNSLRTIGQKTGARETFFKRDEGRPGDLISALFDEPDRKLRLYCIQFGMDCIILGGGGPKTTRTWQEAPELKHQMEMLMKIADRVHERFKDKELSWAPGMKDITGDLEFNDDDDD
jgi:hypothetical protein